MSILAAASAVQKTSAGLMANFDADWDIWGPVGGYVAAIALRGVGQAAAEGHRPVTLTCQFLARGAAGPVKVEVDSVKPGSTACYSVRLLQGETIVLTAQVWTTAKTEGPERCDIAMPDVPPPEELEPITEQLARCGHQPHPFWINMDGRQVDFRAPGVPDPRGCRTERWLRFKDWEETSDPFLDAARALVGIDTHIWASHNRGLSQLPDYVAPSLDLTVWFHQTVPSSDWQLIEARSDLTAEALLSGTAKVWSKDGRLIASGGGQCLVVPIRRT